MSIEGQHNVKELICKVDSAGRSNSQHINVKNRHILGLERLALCPEAALLISSAVFCILVVVGVVWTFRYCSRVGVWRKGVVGRWVMVSSSCHFKRGRRT